MTISHLYEREAQRRGAGRLHGRTEWRLWKRQPSCRYLLKTVNHALIGRTHTMSLFLCQQL